MGSLNTGGVDIRGLLTTWDAFANQLPNAPDLWALQEISRRKKDGRGTHGSMKTLIHREQEAWRGCAILFDVANWTLMRKKKTERGIWAQLRRIADQVEIWADALYIPPAFTHCQHAEAVRAHLEALPPTILPIALVRISTLVLSG